MTLNAGYAIESPGRLKKQTNKKKPELNPKILHLYYMSGVGLGITVY